LPALSSNGALQFVMRANKDFDVSLPARRLPEGLSWGHTYLFPIHVASEGWNPSSTPKMTLEVASDTLSLTFLNERHHHDGKRNSIPEETAYSEELQQLRQSLWESSPEWPEQLDMVGSPLPVLVPEHLMAHLERLGELLCRSVTSIVEQWRTDKTSNFPGRMALLPHQEAILRVSLSHLTFGLNSNVESVDGWPGKGLVPPFTSRKGCWRPISFSEPRIRNRLRGIPMKGCLQLLHPFRACRSVRLTPDLHSTASSAWHSLMRHT
jgi:hypothetical protein